jgi:hypothetical protein
MQDIDLKNINKPTQRDSRGVPVLFVFDLLAV